MPVDGNTESQHQHRTLGRVGSRQSAWPPDGRWHRRALPPPPRLLAPACLSKLWAPLEVAFGPIRLNLPRATAIEGGGKVSGPGVRFCQRRCTGFSHGGEGGGE